MKCTRMMIESTAVSNVIVLGAALFTHYCSTPGNIKISSCMRIYFYNKHSALAVNHINKDNERQC